MASPGIGQRQAKMAPIPCPAVGVAHARPAIHWYWNNPRSATVGDAHVRPAGHVPGGCSPWRTLRVQGPYG